MIKVNNKILIKNTKVLSSLNQGLGLMFYPRKKFNFGLIFERPTESIVGSSIHMIFVFFPINVLFLNSKKEIVDIKLNLKPFRLYAPKKKAKYIIELPIEIDLFNIKFKDNISW
jgi:uncharacterized membrane protein (UPF0127 family)